MLFTQQDVPAEGQAPAPEAVNVPSGPIDRALWNDSIASFGELGADAGLPCAMKRAAGPHPLRALRPSQPGQAPDHLQVTGFENNLADLRGAIEKTLGPLIPLRSALCARRFPELHERRRQRDLGRRAGRPRPPRD